MKRPLAIVLAAGMGTRMKSDLPKVLCAVHGRPMIEFVLDSLSSAGVEQIVVVVGYRGADVRAKLAARSGLEFAEQPERLGTGHAVMMCKASLEKHSGPVVVVAGDSPMLQASSLKKLLTAFDKDQPACLLGTLVKDDPKGLGRIVRDENGQFVRIVEEKDATEAQRAIQEVNMSTYVFDSASLQFALARLGNENRQKEYYLTDCPEILLKEGRSVMALPVLHPAEALSINTPEELAQVEARLTEMGYSA